MKVANIDQIEKSRVEIEGAKNAFKQVPISKNDGSPNFSFRVFTLEPYGHTPYHQHASEHINYIISGCGSLVDENGSENELKTGDFVLVLPFEKHQYRNKSANEPFIMICAVPKEYE